MVVALTDSEMRRLALIQRLRDIGAYYVASLPVSEPPVSRDAWHYIPGDTDEVLSLIDRTLAE